MSKIYTKDQRHIFFFFFLPKLYFHIRGIYKYYDRKYKSEKMSKLMGNGQMYNVLITVSYLRL